MTRRPALAILATGIVCLSSLLAAPSTHAAYPERPVSLISPWEAGGSTTIFGRLLTDGLSQRTGQSFVFENKPGAAGNIGTQFVARSAPDGHTLLIGSMSTHVLQPALGTSTPFHPVDSFTPIARLGTVTNSLAVRHDLPVKSVAELIAYAKANPGKISYASAGVGSSLHLGAAQFEELAKVEMLHVPYKGASRAAQATAAGETDIVFTSVALTAPYVQSKRLRTLAVAQPQRSGLMPDVPTVAETLPGFDLSIWYGLFAPSGLPPEIAAALARWSGEIGATPEAQARLQQLGMEVNVLPGEAFTPLIHQQSQQWRTRISTLGIKVE